MGARLARSCRLSPLSPLVRGSEVIPTAAVERPLSEVGVPGAKESLYCPALLTS